MLLRLNCPQLWIGQQARCLCPAFAASRQYNWQLIGIHTNALFQSSFAANSISVRQNGGVIVMASPLTTAPVQFYLVLRAIFRRLRLPPSRVLINCASTLTGPNARIFFGRQTTSLATFAPRYSANMSAARRSTRSFSATHFALIKSGCCVTEYTVLPAAPANVIHVKTGKLQ